MKQLLVILSVIVLSACTPANNVKKESSVTTVPSQQDTQADYAMSLYDAADFQNAAGMLEQLSYRPAPEGWHWQLLAADAYLHLGNHEKAQTLINSLQDKQLGVDDLQLLKMLQAGIALRNFAPSQALQELTRVDLTGVSTPLQQRYYLLLAEAYRLSGNLLESANALQQLDIMLLDDDIRLENQLAIVRTLAMLSDTALEMMQPSPPGTLGGWMELARLIKLYGKSMDEISPYLMQWQQQFAGHPAMPELLGGYFQNLGGQYQKASHIAVLLPEQGRYAPAAAAIRQGLMAAWYNTATIERPQLRFYDSSDIQQTWPLYVEAIERGADFVIGPLQKEAVSQLLNAGELQVPVLALNQIGVDTIPPENFYQFSLSPEDEARQVAEHSWLAGKRQPVIISPSGSWGDRIRVAFERRWQELGGQVTETQVYDASKNDFADPIKAMLDIDQSYMRRSRLQRILGENLQFEPRRRDDVDFVFVIANVAKARQIRPQLQFHHALGLPIYTTSHAWSGYYDENADRDIEGINFPDIPWLLAADGELPLSASTVTGILQQQQSPVLRLIAMGIDGYTLPAHVARLQSTDTETLDGQTGQLYMDAMQIIHRQLVWATMRNSKPKVLGYSPRIAINAVGTTLQSAPTGDMQETADQVETQAIR